MVTILGAEQAGVRCPALVTAARAKGIDLSLNQNTAKILDRSYGE